MKLLKLLLLSSIAAMTMTHIQAQTADEIISKWTEAMGGKDKLASLKTIYIESELTVMNNPAPHKTYVVDGKGYKSETDFNGQIIVDSYMPDSGWSVNPLAGVSTPTNMSAEQLKLGRLQLEAAGSLYDYAAKGNKVELLGKDNLNGAAVYKLKLTTPTAIEVDFFIDGSTYYILKEVKKMTIDGQDLEISTVNSDYKKTADGYVMPFSQELTFPGLTLTVAVKKIEINKDIDAGIFEKPKN